MTAESPPSSTTPHAPANTPPVSAPAAVPAAVPAAAPDESRAEAGQTATNASVARATGVLALGNIASRVLGLGREIVLTNLFGASRAVDAFNLAVIVPKALYDLLIGGHVNGALVPVLSEVASLKGRDALWRLVSVLLSLVTVALAVLVLGVELFAGQIMSVMVSDPQTLALATILLRLTAPAMLFMSLFAVLSGTLIALRQFTLPAFASTVFNGSIVVVALLLAPALQVTPHLNSGALVQWGMARPNSGIVVVALGWLVGAVVQMLLQAPGLRGARLHFTLNWRHPGVRQIALLYAPVMFSLILDTLVVRLFSYSLAEQTGVGSIGYMTWATTLIQFPQGLVATAISIAILPTLARQAAAVAPEARAARTASEHARMFKDTLGLGMRLAITLIVPATVGLFVLATPIIALLFQHGAFTAQDTLVTADVLRYYLIGLPFAALDLLLVYAFYARQDTLTPALVGLFSLTLYMVVALLLLPSFGLLSLMIADSTKHIVHALLSAWLLARRLGGFGEQRLLLTLGKTGVAGLAMALVGTALTPLLAGLLGTGGLLRELLLVLLAGGAAGGVFLALSLLLGVDEWRWLVGMLRARQKR